MVGPAEVGGQVGHNIYIFIKYLPLFQYFVVFKLPKPILLPPLTTVANGEKVCLGDTLLSVDGKDVTGLDDAMLAKLIIGPAWTKV